MKQLEAYYKAYIEKVRGLSKTTAAHYAQAVQTASRFLRDEGLIHEDLYEVESLSELRKLRDTLYAMSDFVELNTTGNHMYSNGVDKYILFAEYDENRGGAGVQVDGAIVNLDKPMAPPVRSVRGQLHCWNRDRIIVGQVLRSCGWKCEIDSDHKTFVARRNDEPYLEGHHLIPLARQDDFDKSLDVYANIIGLCPNCHRLLHHGKRDEIRQVLRPIYDLRAERFVHSGIAVSKDEFLALAAG